MMHAKLPVLVMVVASTSLLVACAPEPYRVYDSRTVAPIAQQSVEYGLVEAIEWHRDGDSRPTGLGAVIGGIAGGILGHQIGSGSGNTAATIGGALGGAFVGNQVERANDRDRYRVIVRLENGSRLTVGEVGEGQLRVRDRVRIVGNRVYRV